MNYDIKELNLTKNDKLLLIFPETNNSGCRITSETHEKIFNDIKKAIDKESDSKVIGVPSFVQLIKVSYSE
jgi:hypothetical protein